MTSTRFELFASWLLNTKRGKVSLWWIERAAFLLGLLLAGWMLYIVEHAFFPVIKDWKLDYVQRDGGNYIIGGTMVKDRPCELIATSVMAVPNIPLMPRRLIYQLKPTEILGGNAPTGFVTWGPYEVAIPAALIEHRQHIAFLEVVGHHRCHGLWTQETLYGRVPMERLP